MAAEEARGGVPAGFHRAIQSKKKELTDVNQSKREEIFAKVDGLQVELTAMSKEIWAHPEVCFEERFACRTLSEYLKSKGFEVETGVYGMETAFIAHKGKGGGAHIAFVAEYDALPELGHACGHNLYCCAACGAAVALDELTGGEGITITVVGSPAEEGGGGKIPMVEGGAFDGVDIAMMCHAEDDTIVERVLVATTGMTVEFHGKSAHAGGSPEKGINAATASVLTYNNINALRQHFVPGNIVSAIINEGGVMSNTIPDYSKMSIGIRAARKEQRDALVEKVERCVEAAALVTGCTYEVHKSPHASDDVLPNHRLGLSYREALDALGYENVLQADQRCYGWDFGNVSHACPALAPYMKIGPTGLVGHTDAFRECANSPEGYKSMMDAAKCLCYTAYDYLTHPEMQKEVRAEFERENGRAR